MVDPALVYVGGVTVLFFFWIYGIVSFASDVRHKLIPAYRQYRRKSASSAENGESSENEPDEQRLQELYGP